MGKQHVRGYYRKRHGKSRKGGFVSDYNRAIPQIEREFGRKFKVKPRLIIKKDPYGGTNTVDFKPTQAIVQVDKPIVERNPALARRILKHELRENLYNQHFIPKVEPGDDPAHDYAKMKEKGDK